VAKTLDTSYGESDGMLMLFLVPRRADDSGTVADEGDGKRRHLTSMRDLCFETDLGMFDNNFREPHAPSRSGLGSGFVVSHAFRKSFPLLV
jgi:hypothetical protein